MASKADLDLDEAPKSNLDEVPKSGPDHAEVPKSDPDHAEALKSDPDLPVKAELFTGNDIYLVQDIFQQIRSLQVQVFRFESLFLRTTLVQSSMNLINLPASLGFKPSFYKWHLFKARWAQ